VRIHHPVRDVPASQLLHDRHEPIGMVEALDGADEHLHQLLALLRHISAKHRLERRVDLEQTEVEQLRGLVGDRNELRERGLDEDLLRQGQHRGNLN
jgi:hypothetical protein